MNSNDIAQRQNEPFMLKLQYAAHHYFDTAEVQNYFVWILCFLSAFSVFFPTVIPWYILCSFTFLLDIIAFLLMRRVNDNVKHGADLRNYFDAYSLDIGFDQYTELNKRQMSELAVKAYLSNPKRADMEMRNTGKDNPRGVRDWYTSTKQYTGLKAKFECQKQNWWWSKKLYSFKMYIAIIILVLTCIFFVVLASFKGIIRVILCSAGIIIKILERVLDNREYRLISIKIDAIINMLEIDLDSAGVSHLQSLIEDRRKINVLGVNIIHEILSENLAKMYDSIFSS